MAATDSITSPRPEAQSRELLFASDFDGTKFLTSEAGEGILTVSDAYAEGIRDQLGVPAVAQFLGQGGHQHRTPAEIVADLCPDMATTDIEAQSRRLTATKIAILIEQIGRPLPDGVAWPRPTDGFVEMWEALGRQNVQTGGAITTADLSAGHTPFINRTYDIHGLEHPDFVVTDDFLVEELDLGDIPPDKRAKPAPLLLEVTSGLWRAYRGLVDSVEDAQTFKRRITYTGDSEEKDGGLARNYGVGFVLLNPNISRQGWLETQRRLDIGVVSLKGAAGQ